MTDAFARMIADLADHPEELEQRYRANRAEFVAGLPHALTLRPDSIVLRAWQARLAPETVPAAEERLAETNRPIVALLVGLGAISGTLAKLPAFFGWANAERYYSRNVAFFFLPALAAYFIARQTLSWPRVASIAAAFVAAAIVINAYPDAGLDSTTASQSLILAFVHLPLFLWTIVGVAFAGASWRAREVRIGYVRLNGEAIINFALICITGAIMTALTLALFSAIKIDIGDWYFHWVVVYGACAAPLVAMHLALARSRRVALAPLLARIFSPLALITLIAYLGAMAVQGRSPYADREFLVIFNVMLICVLGIAVFCICERKANRWFDLTIWALVLVALLIDGIALSAIIVRLTSYGFTPNRAVTLVTNLLVFVNLAAILGTFTRAAFGRTADATPTREWVARFLPIYGGWTAVVVFVLPALFRFR